MGVGGSAARREVTLDFGLVPVRRGLRGLRGASLCIAELGGSNLLSFEDAPYKKSPVVYDFCIIHYGFGARRAGA